jgi:hypothetical protein
MRILIVVLAAPFFINPASAETVAIRRWCQTLVEQPQLKRDVSIIVLADGKVVARSHYYDGSSGDQELVEQSGNTYLVKGSPAADKYRIVKSSGDLQILDVHGLVDVAEMVPVTAPANACVK